MDTGQLLDGFKRFATDLTVAGQPVAIDFVVEKHLVLFIEARTAGLRWPGFADLLVRAGAMRADGSALTADQIRASFSRVQRRQRGRVPAAQKSEIASPAQRDARVEPPQARPPPATPRAAPFHASATSVGISFADIDPDLSDAELQAARRRLGDL